MLKLTNNIILVAENNSVDMFDSDIQVFEQEAEIPELPVVKPNAPETYSTAEIPIKKDLKESDLFFAKMGQSLFWLIICIIIFLCIVKFIKNKKLNTVEDETEYDSQEFQPEYIQSPIRKNKSSKLNTPSSIHQCILSFLEITKEN